MTVTVSERDEDAFLAFVLDLAREEMAPSLVLPDESDEATEVRHVRSAAPRERIPR